MATAYTLQEIVGACSGTLYGEAPPNLRVSQLLTDSRRLVFPSETVFFALVTDKNDGHKFIHSLQQKGVPCFVVSRLPARMAANTAYVLVEDTLLALQKLAAWHRRQFSIPVVGITGSNGKTIVKEWLSQLLSRKYNLVKNPRSYNSQTGVPLSVWQMDASHQMAVFEAGLSQPGEMERLEEIIKPRLGIFTNIGPAHDEGFTSSRVKIREKLKLFSHSEFLIWHSDNTLLDEEVMQWATGKPALRTFRWGTAANNDMQVLQKEPGSGGCLITLLYQERQHKYLVPFTDEASLENVMHCIAFLFLTDHADAETLDSLQRLQPVAMRLELRQGINNCTLVNDAYNSDLLSLGIALDFLNSQAGLRRKTLILSDILQAGTEPGKLYCEVAGLLREKKIHSLIGIGEQISRNSHCFAHMQAFFFPDTKQFLENYNLDSFREEGILLKGARDFGFEQISNVLQYKDHQTLLEIDLDALVHNLNVYKSMLRPGVKVTAMVKAFSYGSGSYEIAGLLQYHQVDYLAVAFADEGKELRNAGISMPVMVLNPELYNLDILFRYRLEPEIYSLSLLKRLCKVAGELNIYPDAYSFPVHIKLDTGMHRLGFMEEEMEPLIEMLQQNSWIRVASVFSHFSASDLPDFDAFSREQIRNFHHMTDSLEKGLGYTFLKHMANSAAISRFPDAQMDMVRLGIGLYGVDPNREVEKLLQNVTSFRSVISQIKTVPAGHSVGYNRAAMLTRSTRVAIVPVGYADGLSRRLSRGKGYMMVNGQKAPVLGNISMDMCCLDVTDIEAREGDSVIIFGKELPVTRLARKLDTIPYEIFTGIAARVKRVYYKE